MPRYPDNGRYACVSAHWPGRLQSEDAARHHAAVTRRASGPAGPSTPFVPSAQRRRRPSIRPRRWCRSQRRRSRRSRRSNRPRRSYRRLPGRPGAPTSPVAPGWPVAPVAPTAPRAPCAPSAPGLPLAFQCSRTDPAGHFRWPHRRSLDDVEHLAVDQRWRDIRRTRCATSHCLGAKRRTDCRRQSEPANEQCADADSCRTPSMVQPLERDCH